MPCLQCEKSKVHAKGLCKRCYGDSYYQTKKKERKVIKEKLRAIRLLRQLEYEERYKEIADAAAYLLQKLHLIKKQEDMAQKDTEIGNALWKELIEQDRKWREEQLISKRTNYEKD